MKNISLNMTGDNQNIIQNHALKFIHEMTNNINVNMAKNYAYIYHILYNVMLLLNKLFSLKIITKFQFEAFKDIINVKIIKIISDDNISSQFFFEYIRFAAMNSISLNMTSDDQNIIQKHALQFIREMANNIDIDWIKEGVEIHKVMCLLDDLLDVNIITKDQYSGLKNDISSQIVSKLHNHFLKYGGYDRGLYYDLDLLSDLFVKEHITKEQFESCIKQFNETITRLALNNLSSDQDELRPLIERNKIAPLYDLHKSVEEWNTEKLWQALSEISLYIENGNTNIIEYLISKIMHINPLTEKQKSCFKILLSTGDYLAKKHKYYLSTGYRQNYLPGILIIAAAKTLNAGAIEVLIAAGADIDAVTLDGKTASDIVKDSKYVQFYNGGDPDINKFHASECTKILAKATVFKRYAKANRETIKLVTAIVEDDRDAVSKIKFDAGNIQIAKDAYKLMSKHVKLKNIQLKDFEIKGKSKISSRISGLKTISRMLPKIGTRKPKA